MTSNNEFSTVISGIDTGWFMDTFMS